MNLLALWCLSVPIATLGLDVSPEYIYNKNQPPEFPDCDAKYAGVCAVQIAMGLTQAILDGSCTNLGGAAKTTALELIQSKNFQQTTPGTNFGTIVLDKATGKSLVDTYIPNNVGSPLTIAKRGDTSPYGEVNQPTLLPRIKDGVESAIGKVSGRFVPMDWRWTEGGDVVQVLLYVRECPTATGHVIGIVLGREPIPKQLFASAGSASFGSISNVRRVVGLNTIDILACQTKSEMEEVFYDITYTDKYTVAGGFYIFMYQFGIQGSSGVESTGPLLGLNVAHNVIKAIIGWNISAYRTYKGAPQGLIDQGHVLDLALSNAGATGGKWVDYAWGPLDATYYKLSYTVGVKVDGTKFYLGSGFKMVAPALVTGPSCAVCSASVNMPCATKNSMSIASIALSKLLTLLPENQAFNYLSTDATYKANGFYVFAFNYDGTCVADGSDIANVGKTLMNIAPTGIDGTALNTAFKDGAEKGGAWIDYEWRDSATSAKYKKIAYVTKLYKYTKYFYLGVAFNAAPPAKQADCTADYAEPCAEFNVNRLVAVANTAVLTAPSSSALDAVLMKIADKTAPYSEDGFETYIYTNTLACHATLKAAKKCPPALTDEDKLALAPVVASRGGWVALSARAAPSDVGKRMAYVFPVQSTLIGVDEMVIMSAVKDNRLPRCGAGCPTSSTCTASRCDCDYGFRRNWTNTGTCGALAPMTLSCLDDSMASCTKPGMGMLNAQCKDCPAGTHKPTSLRVKNSPCLACAEGRFSAGTKAIDCTSCALGTYRNTPGGTGCSKCPKGTFAGKEGTVECTPCPAGSFAAGPGLQKCERCPVGTYTSTTGATKCVSCETEIKGSSTLFQGAAAKSDCLCMAGSYDGEALHKTKSCVKCDEGLQCDEAGLTKPFQAKGYYIDNANTKEVYLCSPPEACEGGDWAASVCREPRTGFLCMTCPEGLTLNSDLDDASAKGCKECAWTSSVIVALAPIVVFCCLLGIIFFTHHNALDDNPVFTEAQNTIGQLIMFVQVINACFSTRVKYGEPMLSFMDNVFAQIDPDKVLGQAPCLSEFMKEPVTQYAITIISPMIMIGCLCLAYFISLFACGGRLMFDGVFNVVGEVLVEFYISVTLAIFGPFDCYDHPNGERSVQKYPKIICGQADHGAMMGFAVIGILAYPVNAVVVSLYHTWQLPRSMAANANDLRILIRCHFLFGRWKPETCWFCNVTIIRNFFIAVFPMIMPADQLDVTIVLMIMTLMTALVLTVWFKPRRNMAQNTLDTFISMVQLVIMTFGLSSVHGQSVSEPLSGFLLVLLALVITIVMSLMALKGFQLVHPAGKAQVQYAVYLCHHAGASGAAARVFHSILLKTIKGRIFYDIDELPNDTKLIDSIKVSNNLVVVFGSETLCRTWCIGAIVAAFRKSIPMQSVVFSDPLQEETICGTVYSTAYIKKSFVSSMNAKAKKSLVEIDTTPLRGHGVDQNFVHPAIQGLMRLDPTMLSLRNETKITTSVQTILDSMPRNTCERGTPVDVVVSSLFGPATSTDLPGSMLILIDHMDGDAVAVCRLLRSVFSQKGTCLQDQDIASKDYAKIAKGQHVETAIFLLTEKTLRCAAQLSRFAILWKNKPSVHVVPVVAGLTFDFPDDDYLTDLQCGKVLSLGPNPTETLDLFAGDTVSLKNIADSLKHVMTFLVIFINVANLKQGDLNKAMADTLDRVQNKKGRRPSTHGSKEEALATPEAAAPQKAVEPEGTMNPDGTYDIDV